MIQLHPIDALRAFVGRDDQPEDDSWAALRPSVPTQSVDPTRALNDATCMLGITPGDQAPSQLVDTISTLRDTINATEIGPTALSDVGQTAINAIEKRTEDHKNKGDNPQQRK